MEYFLAIDIGASSGRHIFGWIENGVLQTEEVYRFKNGNKSVEGKLIWDVDDLFKNIVAGLKQAGKTGKIPSYIGIDTWAVDYALLDGQDKRIGEVFAYRDGRTESAAESVHKIFPFERLYQKTGIQFQQFNTVYQLYADKMSGKLDKAESMLMLPDYLNFLLTGQKRQEYTNATSTGMVNAGTHVWDEEIIESLGFDKKLFGELSQPGTVVGELKQEIQAEVGYNATVILPATHDTASAVLAAPLDDESLYISSGTWSLLGIEQKQAHTDDGSREVNYSNEGSVDFKFRYQKNIMGLWILQSLRRELEEKYSFPQMSEMARSVTATELIDVNDNRFLAPESMTAEINNAVGSRLEFSTMLRIVYESLAKSYADAIEELEQNIGKKYGTLNIIGGGCRDRFLNELTAKATGKKVITGPVEATAIGNLIMQMIGSGKLDGLCEARDIIKKSFEINTLSF